MFGVRLDRVDHEVQFVGAVDFVSYVKGHTGPGKLSFDEVMPVNALRVAVLQHEHFVRGRPVHKSKSGWRKR